MKDVLECLRFVRGAVSTKDLVPEMKHMVIEEGTVRTFNGTLSLCSPIDMDITAAPVAVPMVQAIRNCADEVFLSLTKSNRLRVQSGKFLAYIDCVEMEGLPHQKPEGEIHEVDGAALLEGIKACTPFIGNDASRPWTNGILLRDQSMFATNNVCLVEYWLGYHPPHTVNIPAPALKEVQRVKEPPTYLQVSDHSITFHYPDGRWIRSQLLATEWPDLRPILEQPHKAVEVPEELFPALAAIKPFVEKDGRIYFKDGGRVSTSPEDGLGASYEVPGLHPEGIYHVKMLELLDGVATKIDFARYPDHLIFYGHRLRGAIIGQRP